MTITGRYVAVLALLVSGLVVLSARSDVDRVPPHQPLEQMPEQVAGWQGTDYPLDPEVLQILGDGVFLNRVYNPGPGSATPEAPAGQVGLFIGFFATQRTGQAIHSPQNCLPGAGWSFLSSKPMTLVDATGQSHQVGDYVIGNGTVKQEVLYWYRSQGKSIRGEYAAKMYLIADAMRHNRTDGALVRVITPEQPGETEAQTHARLVRFAAAMAPLLPAYIPN